jgi:hypothetical protein
LNQTTNASFTQLVHGLYWSDYVFNTYEKGASKGGSGSYVASTSYEMKIVLKSDGALYYIKGGAYGGWTLIKENTNFSDSVMRIAVTQNTHQATIHEVKVKEAVIATGPSLGAVVSSAGYVFGNIWESGYSNESSATTGTPVAPSGLSVVAVSDTQFNLSWADNTAAETGFEIRRCSGDGCSYVLIHTAAANETSYTDSSAPPSTESAYQLRAVKSTGCAWPVLNSNIASDLSFPAASGRLDAAPLGSQMIRLDWDDDAADEDGYEVEVLLPSGRFVKIADLPANSTSYIDTMSLQQETEYTYRIRPYRGVDLALYSEPASATTLRYIDGNGTCPP